jgi:hypothetical protein
MSQRFGRRGWSISEILKAPGWDDNPTAKAPSPRQLNHFLGAVPVLSAPGSRIRLVKACSSDATQ